MNTLKIYENVNLKRNKETIERIALYQGGLTSNLNLKLSSGEVETWRLADVSDSMQEFLKTAEPTTIKQF
jgi:ribosomal protein S16